MAALGVMAYSLWELWKKRCTAKYEDIAMNSVQTTQKIMKDVQSLSIIHNPKRQSTVWEKMILEKLHIPLKAAQVKGGKWIA